MGCDIHMHTEIKIDGRWHHFSQPEVLRDYLLFSLLAGVRNEQPGHEFYVEPISQPRGIPADRSFITGLCYDHDEADAHSESWLSLDEMELVEKWCMDRLREQSTTAMRLQLMRPFGYLMGNGFDRVNVRELKEQCGIEDARAIFWFDN